MSEKELRDCLDWGRSLSMGLQRDKTLVMPAEKTKWVLACVEALAKKPDLARVADWLLDLAAGEELRNRDHDDIIKNTLKAAAAQLQRDFGFRLIKGVKGGGWEYTE